MAMSSHPNLIILTPLILGGLIWRVRTGTASLAQIGIAFSFGSKARTRFRRAPAVAGTPSKKILASTFPRAVFRAEKGVSNAGAALF